MKQKSFTLKEAAEKLRSFCLYRERCHREVREKLQEMNMIPEARDQIILDLIEGGFLNEERFARSYTRGKFRIKKWGRVRISRELRKRGVSKKNIQLGLSEISEEDYIKTFYELVEKRLDEIHENSQQKRKRKIFDYLGYRGYEYPMIYEVLRELS